MTEKEKALSKLGGAVIAYAIFGGVWYFAGTLSVIALASITASVQLAQIFNEIRD